MLQYTQYLQRLEHNQIAHMLVQYASSFSGYSFVIGRVSFFNTKLLLLLLFIMIVIISKL